MKRYVTAALASLLALTLSACGRKATPLEVLKSLDEALFKGDGAAAMKLLSKNNLRQTEEAARRKGTTAEKLLSGVAGGTGGLPGPEKCQEKKIEGDQAIVECRDSIAKLLYFVREDGEWKFDRGE